MPKPKPHAPDPKPHVLDPRTHNPHWNCRLRPPRSTARPPRGKAPVNAELVMPACLSLSLHFQFKILETYTAAVAAPRFLALPFPQPQFTRKPEP